MWSDRVGEGGWRFRYLSRAVIADGGPQLRTDQGLFVWTPGRAGLGDADEGDAYYAVVTTKGDRRSIAATTGPVHERVTAPRAVHARSLASGRIRVMVQYMDLRTWNGTYDAPRAANGWLGYGRTGSGVRDALVIAYTYAVALPVAAHCPEAACPRVCRCWSCCTASRTATCRRDHGPPAWCAIELAAHGPRRQPLVRVRHAHRLPHGRRAGAGRRDRELHRGIRGCCGCSTSWWTVRTSGGA